MITSKENGATIGKVMVLGFLLATLMAMVLSAAQPAGAATPSGKAFAWGGNVYGTLGNGNAPTDSDVPVAVKNLTGVKSVKAGGDHSLALRNNGTVWAWGGNFYGQLGNGTNGDSTESDVPVSVKDLTNVKKIAGGLYFSLAVTQ